MPWFPDFVNAVQLARRHTRDAGLADPVTQYFAALELGDVRALETTWPGTVVVHDPRAGRVTGHHDLVRFVRTNQKWLASLDVRVETLASTRGDQRAVVELLAHVKDGSRSVGWPVAVVAEWSDDASVEFRTYCSQWPVDHAAHVRAAILDPHDVPLPPVVDRLLAALRTGEADVAVRCFEPHGSLREAVPELDVPRGPDGLRAHFSTMLGAGGIDLLPCAVTDDGTCCAVELNCVRWGGHDLVPQAGLAVHERGPDGLLVEVRRYDDFTAPRGSGTRGLSADADQGAPTGR
jgi:hypothetical protein